MSSLKVVTWNMQGRESNWRWLLENVEFDIALVQEATFPHGLESECVTILHHGKKKLEWGTALVSKSLELIEYKTIRLGYWGFKLAGSLVIAHTREEIPRWFVSVHCGHKAIEKRELFRNPVAGVVADAKGESEEFLIIQQLLFELLRQQRFIVGGDWNNSLLHKKSIGQTKERFEKFAESGFMDSRGKFYDEEQQSFFRGGARPSQLDHIFCDGQTFALLSSWTVLVEAATDLALSDHAPILIQ